MACLWEKVRKSPKIGEKLFIEKETDQIALREDPYAVAWKMKQKR